MRLPAIKLTERAEQDRLIRAMAEMERAFNGSSSIVESLSLWATQGYYLGTCVYPIFYLRDNGILGARQLGQLAECAADHMLVNSVNHFLACVRRLYPKATS